MNIKDVPELYFDSEVIITVISNLMSNAFKYTPQGRITLSLDMDAPNRVGISVRDTGCGIEKESLPYICERYYQVNGPFQASGTGIGLALVKSLAELHDAELRAESVKGEGSLFVFVLKTDNTYPDALHKDDEKECSIMERVPPSNVGKQSDEDLRPLLLIVEDNSDIRQYIYDSLINDFRILQACNGKEGRDIAIAQMPDIIVSDIMMPEMNGIEMTKSLKQDIRTSHVPVILLTAKTSASDQEQGYDSGADSYLTKPFRARLLLSRVRNLLSARRRLAEHIARQNISVTKPKEEMSMLSELDRRFLEKLNMLIDEHIATDDLDMAFMTDKMAMSHSTFYRKVKALTGMSANEYIKKAKLRHSMALLQSKQYSVSEVAMLTGFYNVGNFRESFKREFGVNPSEVLKSNE